MKLLVAAIVAFMLVGSTPAAADGPRYIGQSANLSVKAGTPATFVACWDRPSGMECGVVTVTYTVPQRYTVPIAGPDGTVATATLDVVP
jgi:hypothetical protein